MYVIINYHPNNIINIEDIELPYKIILLHKKKKIKRYFIKVCHPNTHLINRDKVINSSNLSTSNSLSLKSSIHFITIIDKFENCATKMSWCNLIQVFLVYTNQNMMHEVKSSYAFTLYLRT